MPHSHFLRGTTSTRTPRRTSGRRLMRTTVLGATVALVAALLVAGSSATATETSSLDAYVLQAAGGKAIDTSSHLVTGGLGGLAAPTDVAFARDGSRGFVTSSSTDVVSVVDPATNAVVSSIPTGDGPSAVAVSPDGTRVYVMLAAGVVQVLDVATAAEVDRIAVGAAGGLAISPDGATGYVAAGSLHELDLATGTVTTSYPVGPTVGATGIVLSPDGSRGYVTANAIFGGTLVVVDLAAQQVLGEPGFGSFPGRMAITPDGRRLLVAVSSTYVDTGYGAGFIPGRTVRVLDTATLAWGGHIDLGAAGSAWFQQNTASGLAVTPDGGSVYVGVPRTDVVAVADITTRAVTATVPVLDPGVIGIEPEHDSTPAPPVPPQVVDAVADSGGTTRSGGTAVADVLANDTVDGLPATPSALALSSTSSTDPGVVLDASTRAVTVAQGTPVGTYTIEYQVCELALASNCDTATVVVTVRPYALDTAADAGRGSAKVASTVVGDVLVNDRLGAARATLKNVKLTQVSTTNAKVALRPLKGAVVLTGKTSPGRVTLVYRACERALLTNCDRANVTVNLGGSL